MAKLIILGLFILLEETLTFPLPHFATTHEDTEMAQEFLRTYNYYPKYRDGSLEEAVRNFQRFVHTKPSGEVDGETMQWIGRARCGMPDVDEEEEGHRKKRYVLQGSSWNKTSLTYKLHTFSGDLPQEVEERIFARAFETWSSVSPLKFTSLTGTDQPADIEILFTEGYHGDSQPFDGPGRILAHAYFPASGGSQHYDRAELWTHEQIWGKNLLQTATHEIGHSLGLRHTNITGAIMFPFIRAWDPYYRLHHDDVFAIRALYGDICGPNLPCLNGGTCIHEGIISACQCPGGFNGQHCEQVTDPCMPNRCQNGGLCKRNGNQFWCSCLPTYTGRLCASKIDYCSSRPCKNGGICEGSFTSYLCQCTQGFIGKNCEERWHICISKPCYNGATCVPDGYGYQCDCEPGYTGADCERVTTTQGTTVDPTPSPPRGIADNIEICQLPPIDAVTTSTDGSTYFFKGDNVYTFESLRLKTGYPKLIKDEFPYAALGPVDAALYWNGQQETWLFQGDTITIHYNRFFLRSMSFTPSFPGVPFPIDGAFYWPHDGYGYLFKGYKYWKVDLWRLLVIEAGRDIAEWGLDRHMDAIVLYNQQLYAFENEIYNRINLSTKQIDVGYPKSIARWWFQCKA